VLNIEVCNFLTLADKVKALEDTLKELLARRMAA
jgi:hypothetical protein